MKKTLLLLGLILSGCTIKHLETANPPQPSPPITHRNHYLIAASGGNINSSYYVHCQINNNSISNCITESTPTLNAFLSLYSIGDMTVSNGYAYFFSFGGLYDKCPIESDAGIIDAGCTSGALSDESGNPVSVTYSAANNNYLYVNARNSNSLAQCKIDANGNIESNQCQIYMIPDISTTTLINNYLYIVTSPNAYSANYLQCVIDNNGINWDSCNAITLDIDNGFVSSLLSYNESYMMLVNSTSALQYICPNESGVLAYLQCESIELSSPISLQNVAKSAIIDGTSYFVFTLQNQYISYQIDNQAQSSGNLTGAAESPEVFAFY